MKKLLLLVAYLAIINITFAQKQCKTIKEIRELPNNTEVEYTGIATTTFHTSNGILIQDETGYLCIKNATLIQGGAAKIGPNTNITGIYGTFRHATNNTMSLIDIEFNEDALDIEIINKDVKFDITEISLNDLLSNPNNYECRPIKLTDVETTNENETYYIGTQENKINLLKGWDVTIPARGTFEGYYGSNEDGKGFIIPSAEHVTATAYQNIFELKEAFYETDAPNSLSIIAPMLVTYVHTNSDNSINIYAQQTRAMYGMNETTGIVLKTTNNNIKIEAGDIISGVKGLFSSFKIDSNGNIKKGSTLTISNEDMNKINIVSKNNKISTTLIDDLEYIIGGATINYEAQLGITPKGTITKNGEKYILKTGSKFVFLEGINLSKYENQTYAISGVVDAGFINPGKTTIILRKETDIVATNYTFNSIAEMQEAGEPLATGTTYTLSNKVLVTNIHSWAGVDVTIYGIFVQDETAGLYIETYFNPNITIGDSILGITGSYHNFLLQKEGSTFTIISNNNLDKIEPEDVTMATLKANPEKYANRVVKLIGVGHGSKEVSQQGKTYIEKYLYQGKDTMIYDIWEYELYEYNNIIGVFDFGNYKSFSIIPLSQAHIEQGIYVETKVENTTENIIYTYNNMVYAIGATKINIYNLNGQLITNTKNDNLNISNLQPGIYIVIAQNNNNRIITKIIK